jgi:hypothetical protein
MAIAGLVRPNENFRFKMDFIALVIFSRITTYSLVLRHKLATTKPCSCKRAAASASKAVQQFAYQLAAELTL